MSRLAENSYSEDISHLFRDTVEQTEPWTESTTPLCVFIGLNRRRLWSALNRAYYDVFSNIERLERNCNSKNLKDYLRGLLRGHYNAGDDLFDHLILVQRTDAVAAFQDDDGNDVAAVDEVPGLAGIPALSLAVMALHLMALIDDYRDTYTSLENLRRVVDVPDMASLPLLIPKDPAFKVRLWWKLEFDTIAATVIGDLRTEYYHTNDFCGSISKFYMPDENAEAFGTSSAAFATAISLMAVFV